ncbi:MAG: endonuclease III [Nitrososphaerales archaeon]
MSQFVPTMNGEEIVNLLDAQYPKIKTPLGHNSAFQLLIATILSAQCTDAQVNKVTPVLFKRYPDAKSMAEASIRDLERIIRSTGFYHVKAKRLKEVSRKVVKDFDCNVPATMNELTSLPGVGRKTANIVLSAGFSKIEGIAVDTHVKRLSKRIGLSKGTIPETIELDLMRITPRELWPRLSLLLILHGRKICNAKKPLCEICVLSRKCLYYNQK